MHNNFMPFKTKKYVAIAKEPVFVGTGGYRIGRVDNTIVRDPATNLPKIPGSTISGNARYYSWLSYKTEGMNLNLGCAKGKKVEDDSPCGECSVCLTYGFINDKKAQSGLAYFSDARILFFPVSTMIGTIWLTSDEIVNEFLEAGGDKEFTGSIGSDKFFYAEPLESSLPENNENKKILNFGWIMLEAEKSINPENWKIKKDAGSDKVSDLSDVLNRIENRICIVSKNVFQHIVNSNLETRTSVSINPVTGAAESGALFTYEALPRGTVFIMDITYESPKNYAKDEGIEIVIETVEKGLKLFSSLGIGGMGTRGFGKVEVLDNWLDEERYWNSVKKFIETLKSRFSEISKKIEEEKDDNKKQKLEDERKEIDAKKTLWLEYVNSVKEEMEKEDNGKKEILKIIGEILSLNSEESHDNN